MAVARDAAREAGRRSDVLYFLCSPRQCSPARLVGRVPKVEFRFSFRRGYGCLTPNDERRKKEFR